MVGFEPSPIYLKTYLFGHCMTEMWLGSNPPPSDLFGGGIGGETGGKVLTLDTLTIKFFSFFFWGGGGGG